MIKIQGKEVKGAFFGTKTVKKIFLGTKKIWSAEETQKLYIVVTSDTGWQQPHTGENSISMPDGGITLTAHLYLGKEEISERVEQSGFSWRRESNDAKDSDSAWNTAHRNYGRTLRITSDDVYKNSRFSCEFKGDI